MFRLSYFSIMIRTRSATSGIPFLFAFPRFSPILYELEVRFDLCSSIPDGRVQIGRRGSHNPEMMKFRIHAIDVDEVALYYVVPITDRLTSISLGVDQQHVFALRHHG